MNVVFHMTPNSTEDKRTWDGWPGLAEHLIYQHGATITVVGSPKDTPHVVHFLVKTRMMSGYITNMVGKTTLDELIDLLKSCDLLVCVNSFVMHLGVALGVRMFAIVGATEPKVILPPGIPHAYSLYAKDIPLDTVIDNLEAIL